MWQGDLPPTDEPILKFGVWTQLLAFAVKNAATDAFTDVMARNLATLRRTVDGVAPHMVIIESSWKTTNDPFHLVDTPDGPEMRWDPIATPDGWMVRTSVWVYNPELVVACATA